MWVEGGTPIAGATVGILMLEAQFPRIPGDMGNVATWPFPVLYKMVSGASPDAVVLQGANQLLDAFIAGGLELKALGVAGLATNCGFLSKFQKQLCDACALPVAASSLQQVRLVDAVYGNAGRVAVLTISGESMTEAHLREAEVPDGTPIFGIEQVGSHFRDAILGNQLQFDTQIACTEMIQAGRKIKELWPETRAIVLECTNMSPYAAALRKATGLAVYSPVDFICWFQSGLQPRSWPCS